MSEAVECDPCSSKLPLVRTHMPEALRAAAMAASAARAGVEANAAATTPEAQRKLEQKAKDAAEKAALPAGGSVLSQRLGVKQDVGVSLFKWARGFPNATGVGMYLAFSAGNTSTYACPGCGGRAAVVNDGTAPMATAPVAAKGLEERDLRPQAVAAVDKEVTPISTTRAPDLSRGRPEFADGAE